METFKTINNFEDYLISNLGRIKSNKSNKILKNIIDTNGYCVCSLSNEKGRKKHLIHRLVAFAFISNPENKPQVNHKDGNKQNNHVSNLEWCTQKENQRHAWDNGLCMVTDYHKKVASITMSKTMSKSVIDLQTGIFYESLTKGVEAIQSNYNTEKTRIRQNNKTQRFKYI